MPIGAMKSLISNSSEELNLKTLKFSSVISNIFAIPS